MTVNGGVARSRTCFDVAQQRRMFGTRFPGGPGDVEQMARRFADSVLKAVTGIRDRSTRGLRSSRRAAAVSRKSTSPSPDGGGLFRVTDNPTINLFPKFAHSAASVLYLSYKTGEPALYLFGRRGTQTEIRIGSAHGNVIGGALSPDGHRIVAAVESGGNQSVPARAQRRGNPPAHRWARDQRQPGILGRRPTARLHFGPLGHAADLRDEPRRRPARRVTFQGDYNTSPSFSPDGKWLAYQSRSGGFNIFIIPAAGGRARPTDPGPAPTSRRAGHPTGAT